MKDKGMCKGKGIGYKGKAMYKGTGKGKTKGYKRKGKRQGLKMVTNHSSKECPKGGKGRMSAVTEEEGQQVNQQSEWNQEWSQDGDWYDD